MTTIDYSYNYLKALVLQTARDCYGRGLHCTMTGNVLRLIPEKLGIKKDDIPLRMQQRILEAWYDLFQDGYLVWGYNLDNPNEPFFHLGDPSRFRRAQTCQTAASSPATAGCGLNVSCEKPGVISQGKCWVITYGSWMHTGGTFLGTLWNVIREYKHDRHLVG